MGGERGMTCNMVPQLESNQGCWGYMAGALGTLERINLCVNFRSR